MPPAKHTSTESDEQAKARKDLEEANQVKRDLVASARAAGIIFPSLFVDPGPIGDRGATAHLIDTGRINLPTARKLARIFDHAAQSGDGNA
ncbi:hypothetical protein [Streptomyces nigrescens]